MVQRTSDILDQRFMDRRGEAEVPVELKHVPETRNHPLFLLPFSSSPGHHHSPLLGVVLVEEKIRRWFLWEEASIAALFLERFVRFKRWMGCQ